MNKSKFEVHQSHCCILHGCKYGDADCPVVLGIVKQEYLCETCETDDFFDINNENVESQKQIDDKFLKLNRKLKLNGLKG